MERPTGWWLVALAAAIGLPYFLSLSPSEEPAGPLEPWSFSADPAATGPALPAYQPAVLSPEFLRNGLPQDERPRSGEHPVSGARLANGLSSPFASRAGEPPSTSPAQGPRPNTSDPPPASVASPSLAGAPLADLAEVFRFDVSQAWIYSRWLQVSTASAVPGMQGYRVPLVTGTQETDLAGSLTYYYNAKQRLRRITFQGTTGNPARVIQLVQTRFSLKQVYSDGPSVYLFQTEKRGDRQCELRIQPALVVDQANPHRRFFVSLRLDHPQDE